MNAKAETNAIMTTYCLKRKHCNWWTYTLQERKWTHTKKTYYYIVLYSTAQEDKHHSSIVTRLSLQTLLVLSLSCKRICFFRLVRNKTLSSRGKKLLTSTANQLSKTLLTSTANQLSKTLLTSTANQLSKTLLTSTANQLSKTLLTSTANQLSKITNIFIWNYFVLDENCKQFAYMNGI
jgi:hypothetical protein